MDWKIRLRTRPPVEGTIVTSKLSTMKLREVLLWILFAVIVFAFWVFLAGRAEASVKKTLCHNGQTIEVALPAFFYHLQHHEEDYAGECEEPVVDVCENLEGVQETTPEGYVNDEGTCYVPEEPKDYCDTLEGVQAEDEDCPKPEPTCEELQNCPEPPVVEEPKKKESKKDFDYSQGPHGMKGDHACQIEWKTIKGSKKVEIRWAEDMVFGNGYKSLITKDDGAETLQLEGDKAKVEIRGRDSKGSWSESHIIQC